MRLTVAGLDNAVLPNRFKHLFGRYVSGFYPSTHCDGCFVATRPSEIHPGMKDGIYELKDQLFYLCGVGHGNPQKQNPQIALRQTNMHLGVRPRKGSVAAVGSVYGVTFVIEDAQAVPLIMPENLSADIPEAHRNCKMFQFGMQVFEVDAKQVTTTKAEPVRTLRELWKPIA